MFNKIKTLISLTALLAVVSTTATYAQSDLENVLRRFKNWRYSNVSLYEIKELTEVRKALALKESKKKNAKNTNAEQTCVKNADPVVKQLAEEAATAGSSLNDLASDLLRKGLDIPPDLDCVLKYYVDKISIKEDVINHAYLVTSRPALGAIADTIIALMVTTEDNSAVEKNLRTANNGDIFTFDEMQYFKLDTSFTSANLYELMKNVLIQNGVDNRTLEAQGIGTLTSFVPRIFGVTRPLANNEYDMPEEDIQKYMRISAGEPLDLNLVENQLIFSPDMISWKKYDLTTYEDKTTGEMVIDSSVIPNKYLPSYGAELKYGIDEINYSSLWSERVSLSGIFKNYQIGIILPMGAYVGDNKSVMGQDRKLTYGKGTGIVGKFDFPIKVIPKSGLFSASFGYVFGDAHPSDYKGYSKEQRSDYTFYQNDDYKQYDYLVRGNGSLFYTFGLKIDEDYLLRFSLGASLYNIEKWQYSVKDTNEETGEINYQYSKVGYETETIGGISGKIEFMTINSKTPFGGSLQYFDESIAAKIWLMIPLVSNKWALRFDANASFVALKDDPRAWENKSLFMPMARIIYNF